MTADEVPRLQLVPEDQVDRSETCGHFEERVFEQAEVTADRMNAVHAVTEFGASDDLTIIRSVTDLADEQLTSWFYWHYKNWHDPTTQSQGSGAQGLFEDDADLSTLKEDKARIVVRTYPQATAGIPKQLSFDPETGEMRYRYRPRTATAPTEIFLSPLHYPDGYEVLVKGGRLDRDDGRVLTVVPDQEAQAVTVIVRQASDDGRGGEGDSGRGSQNAGGVGDTPMLPATGGGLALTASLLLVAGGTLLRHRRSRS